MEAYQVEKLQLLVQYKLSSCFIKVRRVDAIGAKMLQVFSVGAWPESCVQKRLMQRMLRSVKQRREVEGRGRDNIREKMPS